MKNIRRTNAQGRILVPARNKYAGIKSAQPVCRSYVVALTTRPSDFGEQPEVLTTVRINGIGRTEAARRADVRRQARRWKAALRIAVKAEPRNRLNPFKEGA